MIDVRKPERNDSVIGLQEHERLTLADKRRDGKIVRYLVDVEKVKEHAMEFYWALKEYEDTGLTPEKVKEMKR